MVNKEVYIYKNMNSCLRKFIKSNLFLKVVWEVEEIFRVGPAKQLTRFL